MTALRENAAAAAGVALWRRIADALREEIITGRWPAGSQLPTESALAGRFGVNRHTVRVALRALADDSLVQPVQGRGTFVAANRRLTYRIGQRTRFHDALAGQATDLGNEILGHRIEPAEAGIAAALGIAVGDDVLVLETLSSADARPLSRSTHWLPAARFEGIARVLATAGSLTRAFAAYGVADYVRRSTAISARSCTADEAVALDLAPGAVVLVSDGIDVELPETVLQRVVSRFPALRVELMI